MTEANPSPRMRSCVRGNPPEEADGEVDEDGGQGEPPGLDASPVETSSVDEGLAGRRIGRIGHCRSLGPCSARGRGSAPLTRPRAALGPGVERRPMPACGKVTRGRGAARAGRLRQDWLVGRIDPVRGVLGTGRTPLADSVITVDQRTA